MGRITKEWLKFRRKYLKDHPPNHEGYYECELCHRWVHHTEVELDHILNRSTHPQYRFEEGNIQLVHGICNTNKKLGLVK